MGADDRKYSGPYKGVVVSNVDPYSYGRLLVRVEDVLGSDPCIWAEPVSPMTGHYLVPKQDSGVTVQFINGDLDRAVWTGMWRGGVGEVPDAAKTAPPGTPQIVLATPAGSYLLISDAQGSQGSIMLQFGGSSGPYIKLSTSAVEIGMSPSSPAIKITSAEVNLGNGALTITT
jgi:Type VI secretion system/phage-baseplate injector OB domain